MWSSISKLSFLLVLGLTLTVAPGLAGSPLIQFLDVSSAPEGAFVGIIGEGFGGNAGNVRFGPTPATAVHSWTETKITVAVPAGAGGTVVVETASGDSSTPQPFSTHSGSTKWISKSGNDSNACTQGSPCLTIDRGKSVAAPGDVVLIRDGTYCEQSGSGVGLYIRGSNSGTATRPITYRGYPGETVNVDCCGSCGGSTLYLEGSYLQVANLGATGARGTGIVFTGDQNRVADCRSWNNNVAGYAATSGAGINVQNAASGAKILGCEIHDNGSRDNLDHGFYVKGDLMEIAHNVVYNHAYGYGLQLYDSNASYSGARVHSNTFHHNRNAGITANQGSANAEIYNNVIYSNTRNGIIVAGSNNAPSGTRIYSNTVYGNDNADVGYWQIRLISGSGTQIRNNVVGASNRRLMQVDSGAGVAGIDSNLYADNQPWSFRWHGSNSNHANWVTASGGDGQSIVGDPGFVDAASGDLQIGPTSAALDNADAANSPTRDHDGRSRPSGSGPDRGAYEFVDAGGTSGNPPPDVSNAHRTDKRP